MNVAVIDYQASLDYVLEELTFTRARLAASPLTTGMVPVFDDALATWATVHGEELEHRMGEVNAAALVAAADDDLDLFVDELAKALLIVTKGSRTHPQYTFFFGKKQPSVVKRPILGTELDTLETWVAPLQTASTPTLVQYGNRLADLVKRGHAAQDMLSAAEVAARQFRATGGRKAFVDQVNALRKATYGKLSEMPHASPAAVLRADFAEGFFRHPGEGRNRKPKIADLEAEVLAREAELAKLTSRLEHARAEAANEAAAEAKLEIDRAALAAAKKAAADAAAKVAEIEASLGKR